MRTLKYKCTLLSDVMLSTSAATLGEQTSLDFIPGNNFLGILAADYDRLPQEEQMEIFHSGKVRFGDGHPANKEAKVRSLHVPATFFYPKGKNAYEACYAFQSYSRNLDIQQNGKSMQLKQCRNGYYVFQNTEGVPVPVEKSFALKSAYDRKQRRARDNMMFCYESLDKGQTFLFEVEVDNDALTEKINQALTGIHHIGRSRTAQYGLVRIEADDFVDVPSSNKPIDTINGPRVAVFADSRLIFLNDAGQPVLRPTAKQLGLDGEIDWDLCQVRTFQYAPWNGKRQTRDADRCGFEKGSVFFVKCNSMTLASTYVGSYNNEGFGRVIYNPDFLRDKGSNGKVGWQLRKAEDNRKDVSKLTLGGTPLLDYVAATKKDSEARGDIMVAVNNFVESYWKTFKGVAFASQWGRIRRLAMTHPTKEGIINELFDKTEIRHHYPSPSDNKEYDERVNIGYLVHGVAAKKWAKNGRKDILKQFIEDIPNADYVQQAVVNLASEMGKICTRNGKN